MNEIPLISTPISEPWTAWILLALLLCFILAIGHTPDAVKEAIRDIFSKLERNYNESGQDTFSLMLFQIFRVGVVAMMVYLFCFRGGEFSLLTYGKIVGAVTGMEIIRLALFTMIHFAFRFQQTLQTFLRHYLNIWLLMSILLYVLCLFMVNYTIDTLWTGLTIAAIAVYVTILVWKMISMAPFRLRHLVYILLYLLLMEAIPFGILWHIAKFIV